MDLANDKGNPDSKIFDEIVKNNNDNDQDKRNNDVFSVNYFKVAPWTATKIITIKNLSIFPPRQTH